MRKKERDQWRERTMRKRELNKERVSDEKEREISGEKEPGLGLKSLR